VKKQILQIACIYFRAICTHQSWSYFLIPAVSLFLGWLTSSVLVIPMGIYMCLVSCINMFYIGDKGVDALLYTLPVSRKDIVKGGYILSLVCVPLSVIIGFILMPVTNAVHTVGVLHNFEYSLTIIAVSYFIFAILNIVMFPLLFRFGYGKAKYFAYYLPIFAFGFALGTLVGFGEEVAFKFLDYANENPLYVNGSIFISAAIITFLSYRMSVKLYSKREF